MWTAQEGVVTHISLYGSIADMITYQTKENAERIHAYTYLCKSCINEYNYNILLTVFD